MPAMPPAPPASEIPSLQQRLVADSANPDIRMRLAAAYRTAQQPEQARALLQPMVTARPRDPAPVLLLALTDEDLGHLADAQHLYQQYLDLGPSARFKDQARDRLALVQRRELETAARDALARERALTSTPPTPRTIGVFPFLATTQDTQLEPLGRALAELLSTDLSQTDRLRVLERSRVQLLLDEMKLAQNGLVDPSTAARTGHMLQASRIVQGRIGGSQATLDLQALVVSTTAPTDSSAPPIREQDPLQSFFDMEKRLAFGIYDALGIQLTTAERERVNQRPTQNVQALLAFGFGLEAQDGGRWAQAVDGFTRALQLDPGFTLARQHLEQSQRLARASGQSSSETSSMALADLGPGANLPLWRQERLFFQPLEELIPNPEIRDPSAEVLGTEGLSRTGVIQIIIRNPGGDL